MLLLQLEAPVLQKEMLHQRLQWMFAMEFFQVW